MLIKTTKNPLEIFLYYEISNCIHRRRKAGLSPKSAFPDLKLYDLFFKASNHTGEYLEYSKFPRNFNIIEENQTLL